MFVWGGTGPTSTYGSAYLYDAVENQWTAITAVPGALSPRRRHTAVWTGTRMLIWGGAVHDGSALFGDGAQWSLLTMYEKN